MLLTEKAPAREDTGEGSTQNPVMRFCEENGLSLAFFTLYVLAGVGQSLTGIHAFNDSRLSHGLPALGMGQFLRSGTFLDGVFVNWQAAVLQLGVLILFGAFLHQKGATHSRKEKWESGHKEDQGGDERSWIYRNSLSLAFFAMFVVSFALHVGYGTAANNEHRELERQAPLAVMQFVGSAKFWTATLACWQAEFFAIFAYVILSIFCRQKNSPESKPENSSNQQTGESNK